MSWCFWTLLEKTVLQTVHPRGNQSWIVTGRTDAEAEALLLWPPDVKNWLIGKDPNAGKDWGQEEKEMTEDEMVGWHHRLYGHGFEKTLGDSEGQGSLACCSPWDQKDWTRLSDWTTTTMWKVLDSHVTYEKAKLRKFQSVIRGRVGLTSRSA